MLLGTVALLLLALGMCMVLLPQWNSFNQGIVVVCIGLVVLLVMVIVWRKMENKKPLKLSGKTIGGVLIGILGALLLGIGMCLTMVWSQLVVGVVIGIAGIVVLLCLIPFVIGIK